MKKALSRATTVVVSIILMFSVFNVAVPIKSMAASAEITFFDDELNDFDKTFDKGVDLTFDSYKPEQFEFDFSRVKIGNGNDAWLSWYFESGITEFGVVTFWSEAAGNITVSISKDNKIWTELSNNNITDSELSVDWYKRVFKYYGINKAYKYVKVFLGDATTGSADTNCSVSRVRINNIDSMEDADRCVEDRAPTTYYIDQQKGSDYNIGTLETKPFKTLKNIKYKYFGPGDKILFKSGSTNKSNFILRGMGSAANPITIGTYGGNEKAKLTSNDGNTLSISMQYVNIENLEITNPNGKMGIYIIPNAVGENNNITVRNCYIHDVNGDHSNFTPGVYDTGGIYVSVNGSEPTWIKNLLIENNVIENVSRCGIFINTNWAYRPGTWGNEGYYNSDTDGWYPYINPIIRNNTVNRAAGDSILVSGSKNALVEKNTVINGFAFEEIPIIVAVAQVWCVNTNDSIFQYNEVSYSNLPMGCGDGESFDIDIASVRAVFQYNYSHDNEGGFMLICNNQAAANLSRDNIVRFNLSVNDGSSSHPRAPFMIDRKNDNTHIYNNTIYMKDTDRVFWQYSDEDMPTTDNFRFTNNIFYGASNQLLKWVVQTGWKDTLFDNNVFYNANVDELKGISGITVTNEVLANPQFANENIDTSNATKADAITAFTPQNKLHGAVDIENSGNIDITGSRFNKIDFFGCVNYNYTDSFKVNEPFSLTDTNGNADTVKIDVSADLPSALPGEADHRRLWWDNGDFVGNPTGYLDRTVDPAVPADDSIPLAGYNIQTADGSTSSSGMVTYYSPSAISSVRFDTSYSIYDDYWIAEPLEFYASSDGVTFNKIDTDCVTVGNEFKRKNDETKGMYAQIYDTATFGKAEDIHYLRIVSTIKDNTNIFSKQINRIYAIEYNRYERKDVEYNKSFNVAAPFALTDLDGETSNVSLSIADNLNYAAIGKADNARIWYGNGDFVGDASGWNGADTSVPLAGYNIKTADGSEASSGTVTYYSKSVIKDIRLDTSYSVNDDYWIAKPLEFYASSDGVNYKRFYTECNTVGTEFTRTDCAGMYSQIYDEYTFCESEDIHFIRIVSTVYDTSNVFAKEINRIYAVDYNAYSGYSEIVGDANNDYKVDVIDLVHYKCYLANKTIGATVKNRFGADINTDGSCDALDLTALKKILLSI